MISSQNPVFFSVLLLLFLSGCGGRNLYKNTRLDHPPLERGYVYMTREQISEAGDEPVEFASPVATSDTIFVPSETHGLEAFVRSTFQRKWKLQLKNGISGGVVLDGNTLYFGANDGKFYAVDAEFGKVLWKHETKVPVFAKPAISGDRIFISSSDDILYCLEKATGKWVWHYKRGGSYITTIHGNAPATVDGGFVYVGFSDGYLVALNLKDGNLVWEQKIHKGSKFTDVDAQTLIDGEYLYAPSYDGQLYALEKTKGKVLWYIDIGGAKKVLLDDSRIYLASSNGGVYSIDKTTGRVDWKFELDDGAPTSLILHESYLAFGSSKQYFYAIHKGDGSLAYRHNVGLRSGFVSHPTQHGRDIFALSNFGNLYVFRWNTASSIPVRTSSNASKSR